MPGAGGNTDPAAGGTADRDGLRFADVLFDNLFADLAVRDQIHSAKREAQAAERQIQEALDRLRADQTAVKTQRQETEKAWEALLLQAEEN